MELLKRKGGLKVQILSRMMRRICFKSSPAEGGSVVSTFLVQPFSSYILIPARILLVSSMHHFSD